MSANRNPNDPATKADVDALTGSLDSLENRLRADLLSKDHLSSVISNFAQEVSRQFGEMASRDDALFRLMEQNYSEFMRRTDFIFGKYQKFDRGHDLISKTVEDHENRIKALESKN